MTSRNRQKGTAWETAVADYLNEVLGQYKPEWRGGERSLRWVDPRDSNNVVRTAQTGSQDIGDLTLWPAIGEAKNERQIRLPEYVHQANMEARRAGADYGVAFVKRRGKGTADGYAVMDIETFSRVLRALRGQ